MRRRVTVLGRCVCVYVCLRVCPAPRVLPLRATERPTEGTYGFGAIWEYGVFSLCSKVMTKSYGADGATFRQKLRRQGLFWFFQSLTAGYKLPGIVSELLAYRAFAFVVFRTLSVTCSLTRALSQSLAHAQQLFSASTPGQILAHFSKFENSACIYTCLLTYHGSMCTSSHEYRGYHLSCHFVQNHVTN